MKPKLKVPQNLINHHFNAQRHKILLKQIAEPTSHDQLYSVQLNRRRPLTRYQRFRFFVVVLVQRRKQNIFTTILFDLFDIVRDANAKYTKMTNMKLTGFGIIFVLSHIFKVSVDFTLSRSFTVKNNFNPIVVGFVSHFRWEHFERRRRSSRETEEKNAIFLLTHEI